MLGESERIRAKMTHNCLIVTHSAPAAVSADLMFSETATPYVGRPLSHFRKIATERGLNLWVLGDQLPSVEIDVVISIDVP